MTQRTTPPPTPESYYWAAFAGGFCGLFWAYAIAIALELLCR